MATFALHYMTRFVCLGGECPDICCREWPVHLSRGDFQVLQESLADHPQHRDFVLRGIAMDPLPEHSQLAGRIVWNERNECPFLDERRLCGLYTLLGPEAQPAVCAQYPRSFIQFGGRLELVGALSCPEVVRLILTMAQPLHWQEVAETTHHPRLLPQDPCVGQKHTPWCQQAGSVRQVLERLITMTGYPLASRLMFCAFFAQRTQAGFRKDSPAAEALPALQQAMALAGDPGLPEILHQQLASMAVSAAMAVEAIKAIASHGIDETTGHNPYFRHLIRRTLAGYGPASDASALWHACLARQRTLEPQAVAWTDHAFYCFAHHYLLQEPYLHYDDLMAYIRRLTIAVMVCRFLFYGLLGEGGQDPPFAMARVQQTMITTLHGFSKSFSHYRLEFAELDSLPKLLMFMRLW